MGGYDDIHDNVLHWLQVLAKKHLRKHKTPPVFYDIGAHKGYFTTMLSEHCKCVIAFEPEPRSFVRLANEVVLYTNILLIQRALWSRVSGATMYHYSDPSFDSLAKRSKEQCKRYNLTLINKTHISVFPLDEIVKEKNLLHPDIIKIDVEGAELMVLEGAKVILKQNRPYIISEYSIDNTENFSYTREELHKQFKRLNYQLFGMKRKTDRKLYRDLSEKSIWNVLAVPI